MIKPIRYEDKKRKKYPISTSLWKHCAISKPCTMRADVSLEEDPLPIKETEACRLIVKSCDYVEAGAASSLIHSVAGLG